VITTVIVTVTITMITTVMVTVIARRTPVTAAIRLGPRRSDILMSSKRPEAG
jgi:hypothetical protein